MKCNHNNKTKIVCTYWEKCSKARICPNVPIGIKNKLNGQVSNPQVIGTSRIKI